MALPEMSRSWWLLAEVCSFQYYRVLDSLASRFDWPVNVTDTR
jgi:hypothetical protein